MPRTGLTPEQLKEKALDAVIEQMKLVGFDRVKLSDIAKSLGVSHAALYSHFADKSALFDAVIDRWLQRFDDQQETLCVEQKPHDSLERLTQWFINLHRMKIMKVRHEPEMFKAYNFPNIKDKEFAKRHMATMRRQVTDIVTQAVDDKLIAPPSVEHAVMLFFESTIGFHHPAMVAFHAGEDREPFLREVIATVVAGLQPPR